MRDARPKVRSLVLGVALGLGGLCLAADAETRQPPVPGDGPFAFEEGARKAGILFEQRTGRREGKRHLIETIGSGVVVADFNGDDHLDVYLVNGGTVPHRPSRKQVNLLFFGDGNGRFRPGPPGPARDRGFGIGAVAADYDRDGDLDLYLCNWGPNVLLRNRGDGSFESVTETAGVGDPAWSTSAAFGDLDGDGWLDLYVGNYYEFGSEASLALPRTTWSGIDVAPGPRGFTAQHDRLYRNRGDGTFADVSGPAGLLAGPARYALAVLIEDLDGDGHPDVYVANDSQPNTYWHGEPGGRLVDMGLETGLALSGEGIPQAGMGLVVEDFNRDGLLDLVVTNFARDFNTYYQGFSSMSFQDLSYRAGLASTTFSYLAFGVAAEDFDRDGNLDLLFANGHVYPEVDEHPLPTRYAQPNQIFRGRGDGTFEDVTRRSGPVAASSVSRGAAAGDLDEDGDVDVVINNLDGRPHLLWNTSPGDNHWLAVRLRGAPGRMDRTCVGSVVTVQAGGRTSRRSARAGGSFASAGLGDLVFGLGASRRVDRLVVRFAGGASDVREDIAADQVLVMPCRR